MIQITAAAYVAQRMLENERHDRSGVFQGVRVVPNPRLMDDLDGAA